MSGQWFQPHAPCTPVYAVLCMLLASMIIFTFTVMPFVLIQRYPVSVVFMYIPRQKFSIFSEICKNKNNAYLRYFVKYGITCPTYL